MQRTESNRSLELSDDDISHPDLTGIENLPAELLPATLNSPETSTNGNSADSIASKQSSDNTSFKPRDLFANMTESTISSYQINGVKLAVTSTANARKSETLYPKAKRKTYTEKEKQDYIKDLTSNHQNPKFHTITVSVTDPEKMTNTHSLQQLLSENRRNMLKFDLLDVFTIVVPEAESFNPNSSKYRHLQTDETGTPTTYDLFTDYLSITAEQVALSSKWYSCFVDPDELMQENLTYSLAYYEQNVETTLYSKIHAQLLTYETDMRGGPLFLKLLLDRCSTTTESNLKAMMHIAATYEIKKSMPGEDIEKVVELFDALFNNMAALKNGQLPENSLKNLLLAFQTTSVDEFNDLFKDLNKQRLNNEVKAAIDPVFAKKLQTSSSIEHLTNTLDSVKHVLAYADLTYRRFVEDGEWDRILQRPAGQASFMADNEGGLGPTRFRDQTDNGTPTIVPWENPGDCFNCGRPNCTLSTCPFPKDDKRIQANKQRHPSYIRSRNNKVKFRPPEPNENNKRIIDGHPYEWNPNGGWNRKGRWVKVETPDDGQPNNGQATNGQTPHVNLAENSDTSTISSKSTKGTKTTVTQDKFERELEIHKQIAALQEELEQIR